MTDHFFTRINIVANSEITIEDMHSEKTFDHEFKYTVDTLVNNEDDSTYQVRLGITAGEKKDFLKGYDIEVETVGFFQLVGEYQEDKKNEMIHILGATLLYSAAREFIYATTMRGPWPPIYLPTTSFIPEENC